MLLNMNASSAAQNDEFCNCIDTCGKACDVANRRTGFMYVGYLFAIWFVISMVTAVCRIPERRPSGDRPKAPPIVPAMRSAMNNPLFRILLPAWLCDSFVNAIITSLLPYYIEGVVVPAYSTMEVLGSFAWRHFLFLWTWLFLG